MTANLPDNVTTVSEYVVHCTAADNPHSDITVSVSELGSVRLKQDDDTVLINPADVPGLIAALSAAAVPPLPEAPKSDPAVIIDGQGDRWERQEDGRFVLCGNDAPVVCTRDYILRVYGIRPEG